MDGGATFWRRRLHQFTVAAFAKRWTPNVNELAKPVPLPTISCVRFGKKHSHLPRLADSSYKGSAFVHWNFSIKLRKTGWLNDTFHYRFRETLLHALGRYGAICPAYCLMPDHVHLLLLGWDTSCNQRTLVRFFRKHTNVHLKKHGIEWQKQPYDNVLRPQDREKDAFQKLVGYILLNPVRKCFVNHWEQWTYLDSMIPGYPEVSLRDEDFWERFWRIYYSKH